MGTREDEPWSLGYDAAGTLARPCSRLRQRTQSLLEPVDPNRAECRRQGSIFAGKLSADGRRRRLPATAREAQMAWRSGLDEADDGSRTRDLRLGKPRSGLRLPTGRSAFSR